MATVCSVFAECLALQSLGDKYIYICVVTVVLPTTSVTESLLPYSGHGGFHSPHGTTSAALCLSTGYMVLLRDVDMYSRFS